MLGLAAIDRQLGRLLRALALVQPLVVIHIRILLLSGDLHAEVIGLLLELARLVRKLAGNAGVRMRALP